MSSSLPLPLLQHPGVNQSRHLVRACAQALVALEVAIQPITTASVLFPATLSAATINPLPTLHGYFSFPLYISKVSPDAAVLYGTLHC